MWEVWLIVHESPDLYISGKGLSLWDMITHSGLMFYNDTGDIACDSYHKYLEDVQLVKNLGVGQIPYIYLLKLPLKFTEQICKIITFTVVEIKLKQNKITSVI